MANIVCGIDKPSQATWFAFNKKTGNFACLTNFRTLRNKMKRDYESRGSLVLDFVKIDDEDIFEGDRMPMSTFMERLRCDKYKGFNLLYGNIFDHDKSRGADSGTLKVYQDQNWIERPDIHMRLPLLMRRTQAHGLSNGDVDKWMKVVRGRYEFFKIHLRKENEAEKLKFGTASAASASDKDKLRRFMEDYSEELHSMMIDDTQ